MKTKRIQFDVKAVTHDERTTALVYDKGSESFLVSDRLFEVGKSYRVSVTVDECDDPIVKGVE